MADNGNQANGSQGQEPGTGSQGQGQEPAQQQGQQDGQGQEPGQSQQGGQQGQQNQPADVSKMTEAELRTYAAKLQTDAQEARQEAARYRTQHQTAQQQLTEAQRAQMTEQERIQADLEAAQTSVQEKDNRIQELEGRIEDLTKGAAVRDALAKAGAINAATAFRVGDWSGVKVNEDGTLDTTQAQAAIQALRQSDPYLFRRGANADPGNGIGNGSPDAGSSINDFVRGNRR